MTKGGIYLDLKQTEYIYTIYGLSFYFSSKFYKEKFEKNVQKYVKDETYKLINKYKNRIDFTKYLAISFYRKIEKRGFLIKDNSGIIKDNCTFKTTIY